MKENLVIIHGWGKKESWKEALDYFSKFDIYLLDLPGFEIPLEKPFTFEDYLNYLEKEIKLKNFFLLGHSFGGALAMLYALKYPSKIKTLILYNPAIIRKENLKTKISSLLARIFKILEKILPQKISYLLKKSYYKFIVKSYDYFLAEERLKKTFENIRIDLKDKAKELKVKTYLLWGEQDNITTLSQGKILKEVIPQAKLITFKGGHSFHKENPKEFVRILENLIE